MPLERSNFDGDSGAGRAVTAALLTALSDETRRGRSLLIGTTNCPWRMGAAMRSRFTVIPVLHPLREDFAAIVVATARRISKGTEFDEMEPIILQASEVFYEKGANPRHIHASLANVLLVTSRLSAQTVLDAAHDFCGMTDLRSAIYADLWAVYCCSSRMFFPWNEQPSKYPFADHLKDLVDLETGHARKSEIEMRLKELSDGSNL